MLKVLASSIGNRAGPMAVIAGEKLFTLGGSGSATDTTFGAGVTSGRDAGFLPIGDANAPAPIAWATYAGHRYAEELDAPDIGDAVPFRR